MKLINNGWFWFLIFLVALFAVTYTGLSYGVDKLMGDKVYGESLEVTAVVEGFPVTVNTGSQVTAPASYVQSSKNVVQPELLNAKFVGVQ